MPGNLHSDSIQIEDRSGVNKVSFEPVIGVAPFRYRDLFEKGRRKDNYGEAKKWKSEPRKPIVGVVIASHLDAEKYTISELARVIAEKKDF